MRIFLIGTNGLVDSHVLPALQASSHQVIGPTRSDTVAQTLRVLDVEVHRGTLDAPDSLLISVEGADAVIHTVFNHDFSHFAVNYEKGCQAILTMGRALQGSARSLVIISDTLIGDGRSGVLARGSFFNSGHPNPRTASELADQQLLETGADARVVRLPQVHDTVRQGLLISYIERVVANGAVALHGEGSNRWSVAHVNDVARLYVSALLQGTAGECYHAVAEEGIVLHDTATVIARGLNLPLTHPDESQADARFGWSTPFTVLDLRASLAWTRE